MCPSIARLLVRSSNLSWIGYKTICPDLRHVLGCVRYPSLSEINIMMMMIQLIVELADVRIFAFGTLARPRSDLTVNLNAHFFFHPPGIKGDGNVSIFTKLASMRRHRLVSDHGVYPMSTSTSVSAYRDSFFHAFYYITTTHMDFQVCNEYITPSTYSRMTYPQPAPTHINYPFFTPGGRDLRWSELAASDDGGLFWVGSMMFVAKKSLITLLFIYIHYCRPSGS